MIKENRFVHFLQRLSLDGRLYLANNIVSYIPSHRVRLFFYRSVMNIKIGDGTSIFMRTWLDTPGNLTIGRNSTINQGCRLDARGGLSIGDNVSISADVCILTAAHDVESTVFEGYSQPVDICDFVFIGTRAMILAGVSLGTGSIVAAGAVVTKNVEAYSVVAGVPARVIGRRPRDLNYIASYPRLFH